MSSCWSWGCSLKLCFLSLWGPLWVFSGDQMTRVSTLDHQTGNPWNFWVIAIHVHMHLPEVLTWDLRVPQTCQGQAAPQNPACWFPSRAGSGPSLGCHQGDAALHCCMEILLKLNGIKGQLCPDKNRKHNCTRLLDSMYHRYHTAFKEFGLLTSRIVFHVSSFSRMRFIYPVGGKEQYGAPVCFSLKSFCF